VEKKASIGFRELLGSVRETLDSVKEKIDGIDVSTELGDILGRLLSSETHLTSFEKSGLCLAGGGAFGAYEVGVYQAMQDIGIKFDMVSGSSVGAINAAFIAGDKFKDLKYLWEHLEPKMVRSGGIDTLTHVLKIQDRATILPESLFSNSPLKRNLIEHFGETTTIGDLPTPLFVTGTDVHDGECVIFPKETRVWEAVAASAAFPGVFPPQEVEVDGVKRLFSDGGTARNLPIFPLIDHGCSGIYAVILQPSIEEDRDARYDFVDILFRTWSLMSFNQLTADLTAVESYNRMVAAGKLKRPKIKIRTVRLEARKGNMFDFSAKQAIPLINQGYEDGMAALGKK